MSVSCAHFPSFKFSEVHLGSLKSVLPGVFTSQIQANDTEQGFVYREKIVVHLPAHHGFFLLMFMLKILIKLN